MAKPVGPYSPVVKAGDIAYVAGQIGLDNGVVVEGFENQVRQSISNVESVLKDEGMDLSNVVMNTIYVTDMGNFAKMNDIYLQAFSHLPARAAVEVSALPLGAEFEIVAVAHVR